MQIKAILRILGILLMIFSISMVPPVLVAEWYRDGGTDAFVLTFFVTAITGFSLWFFYRKCRGEIKIRDGFLLAALFWFVLSLFGALPFAIPGYPHVTITDAVFESVSGLTTTGTNVLSGIDHFPHALRYYRQQLQFLGGMGIIVLAVAILPMLGIGGMQLYRAEMPGPIKDQKLAPRITETAKRLWLIYVGLMLACATLYWMAGMSLFDAIGESFSTVSTGGFSVHSASFAYHSSVAVEIIGVIFMILGATSFNLHYTFLQRRSFLTYWRDIEFRNFVYLLMIIWLIVMANLLYHHVYENKTDVIVKSLFNVISLGTTTGLTSAGFASWPTYIPYLIMINALIGGCAGSTSGGIKVLRALLLRKQGARELKRLVHPHAVYAIRFGDQILPERVVQGIWGFIAVFLTFFVVVLLCLLATHLDFTTAFGATVSCLSNCGASIGKVANGFANLSNPAKWILIFTMFAGRLEVFSLLVLFTPVFWRR